MPLSSSRVAAAAQSQAHATAAAAPARKPVPAPAVEVFDLPGLKRGGAGEPLARIASGLPALDALLGGGWPRGRMSELCGASSSGRTAVALHTVATTTIRGGLVAWVDCADALSPLSLARAGAVLARVLWVRPPNLPAGLRCAELLAQSSGFVALVLDLGDAPPRTRASLAPWVRLQRAAERGQTALLLLSPHAVAGSLAALRLRLQRRALRWQRGAWPLFLGWESVALLERNKLGSEGKAALLPVCSPAAVRVGRQ